MVDLRAGAGDWWSTQGLGQEVGSRPRGGGRRQGVDQEAGTGGRWSTQGLGQEAGGRPKGWGKRHVVDPGAGAGDWWSTPRAGAGDWWSICFPPVMNAFFEDFFLFLQFLPVLFL